MADPIPELLLVVTQAFRRRLGSDGLLDELGLSPTHAAILGFISRMAEPTQQELVSSTGMDKGLVARTLKQLEDQNLIARTADPADRRIQRIAFTSRGERVWKRLRCHREEVGAVLLSEFSGKERAELARLLEKLRARLD